MKMKKLFYWLILPLMVLTLAACGGDDDVEDVVDTTGVPFESMPTSNTNLVKDFQMSDIELLVEMSLKMEGLRLQYFRMMSDDWQGDLLCGDGEHTDGTKFFDYATQLLENADAYKAAITKLENDGILTNATTRGIGQDFAEWCVSLTESTNRTQERMKETLLKNNVTGNAQAMQALFNELTIHQRKGETDAKQWFVNFFHGDYESQVLSVQNTWMVAGEGDGVGHVAAYFDTYTNLYDKGAGNPQWKEAHEITKNVAEKAGSFYVSCIDEVTGGFVGKWVDFDNITSETKKLAKKIRDGKATTSDMKKFLINLGSKYVKEKSGEIFEGAPREEDIIRLAGEITDYATTHATEGVDEEIAEGLGVNLWEIQKTLDAPTAVIALIEDVKEGNITIGFPDKNGDTHLVTEPGDKMVTVITSEGERATEKVSEQKPGLVVVEPAKEEQKKATVMLSPETLDVLAKGGSATVTIKSNCPYSRFRMEKEYDWFKVSRSGKTLTIRVDENESESPRTGSFVVDVSFEGKKIDASTTFTFTQMGAVNLEPERPQIEVDTNELAFDAEGGTKKIMVDSKTYEYYGGFTDDECADWLDVTPSNKEVSISITAKPNKSSEKREGNVYIFGTNNPNPQSVDDISYVIIPVTQAGKKSDPGSGDGGSLQIDSVWVRIRFDKIKDISSPHNNGWIEYIFGNTKSGTKSINCSGNHVAYEYEVNKSFRQEDADCTLQDIISFSFDLNDVGGLRQCSTTIDNVEFDQSYMYSETFYYNSEKCAYDIYFKTNSALRISGDPFYAWDYYDAGEPLDAWWQAEGSDLKFSDFYWREERWSKDMWNGEKDDETYSTELLSDDNSMEIKIFFRKPGTRAGACMPRFDRMSNVVKTRR